MENFKMNLILFITIITNCREVFKSTSGTNELEYISRILLNEIIYVVVVAVRIKNIVSRH